MRAKVGRATKVIACVLALSAFAIAIVAGLAAGNAAEVILSRALVAMLVCQGVGLAIGSVGEGVIRDYLRAYERANPIPRPAGVPAVIGGDGAPTGESGQPVDK